MRILNLTTTDPAGAIFDFSEAINRHVPGARSHVLTTKRLFEFDFGHHWSLDEMVQNGQRDLFEELIIDADVLIVHKPQELGWFHANGAYKVLWDHMNQTQYRYRDIEEGARVLFVHHGEPWLRNEPAGLIANNGYASGSASRDDILVVSPDLLELLPMARYFPGCITNRDGLYQPWNPERLAEVPGDKLLIGHTPTPCWEKNGSDLLAGAEMAGMKDQVMIEPCHPQIHLRRLKRRFHIGFDQLACGIVARNGLETMAMGIPTLARISEVARRGFGEFFGVTLPALNVEDSTGIGGELIALAENPQYRAETSKASAAFVANHWDEAIIARRFAQEILGMEVK